MLDPDSNLAIVGSFDLNHVLVQNGRYYSKSPAVTGLVEDHIADFRLQVMAVALGDVALSGLIFDAFRL